MLRYRVRRLFYNVVSAIAVNAKRYEGVAIRDEYLEISVFVIESEMLEK